MKSAALLSAGIGKVSTLNPLIIQRQLSSWNDQPGPITSSLWPLLPKEIDLPNLADQDYIPACSVTRV